jgi:hypothetical protein
MVLMPRTYALSRMPFVEGHMVSGYADGGDEPDKQLQLVPDAFKDADAFLRDKTSAQIHLKKVSDLVERFEL